MFTSHLDNKTRSGWVILKRYASIFLSVIEKIVKFSRYVSFSRLALVAFTASQLKRACSEGPYNLYYYYYYYYCQLLAYNTPIRPTQCCTHLNWVQHCVRRIGLRQSCFNLECYCFQKRWATRSYLQLSNNLTA